jgi:hypothetical protein
MVKHAGRTFGDDINALGGMAAATGFPDLLDFTPSDPGQPDKAPPPASPVQIVFIEANVPDAQDLANGVQAGVQAVLLDPSQDGVTQIADYLTSHHITNLAGIDIVAHGADGAMQLGSATLSSSTIADYQAQLAQIGAALTAGGAIQLYGCDVAEDAAGVSFLDQLSQATGGANIAAASHLVGDAAGGGSFNLNVNVGTIDVATPFTSKALTSFQGELATSTAQLFMTAGDGHSQFTRIQQVGVDGSNPIDLGNQTQSGYGALSEPFAISINAPLGKYFLNNLDSNSISEILGGNIVGGGGLTTLYHTGSSSTTIGGMTIDQPAGSIYFGQVSIAGSTGNVTIEPGGTGIFKISEAAVNATTATRVVDFFANGASGTHLVNPYSLALDKAQNLLFFTETDHDNAFDGGLNRIDVANLTTGTWTVLFTFASSVSGGEQQDGENPTVAVNPLTNTLYVTTNGITGAPAGDNAILSASYTVTGSGASASVNPITTFTTLYSGAGAFTPQNIQIDPANGVFYTAGIAASGLGEIYQGLLNHTGAGSLTPIFSIAGAGPGNEIKSVFLETTPTIAASGSVNYIAGSPGTTLDSGLVVSNEDGQNLASATVAITGGTFAGDGDTLVATTAGTGITFSYNAGTETATLTTAAGSGGDTIADFQQVLDSVKFSSTSLNPTNTGANPSRTISWSGTDGIVTSGTTTSTVTIQNALTVNASGTATFDGGGSPVPLDPGLTITDLTSVNLTGATISIHTNFITGDTLNFTAQSGISEQSFTSGTLVLTGTASATQYTTALDSITFSFTPSNGDPTGGVGGTVAHTIDWQVASTGNISNVSTSTLNTVHVAPTLSVTGASIIYPEGGAAVPLASSVTATDPDSLGNLASATVTVSGPISTDRLNFTNELGITGSYNVAQGKLTLTGTTTIANYEAALQSVTYSSTGDPTNGGTEPNRTIAWQVNDGVANSGVEDTSLSTLCFCAGTQIATPTGEVPVERLAVGDLVLTLDGRRLPINWVGTGQSLLPVGRPDGGPHEGRSPATPVIVRAGALGDDLPRRDLRITKGHSLYLEGVLIPVENLINHRTILWDDEARKVVVYHIELSTHEVLLANGAPAESYRDDGNRVQFQNTNPGWDLAPVPEPFAPIVTNGPVVEAIWQRLAQRAEPCAPIPLTRDPDLHLLIDGARVAPSMARHGIHAFEIMPGAAEVQIASRSAIPSELGLNGDQRRLGVAVQRIVLHQQGLKLEIDAESAKLEAGFQRYEPAGGFRWTDGAGVIPHCVLGVFAPDHPVSVEVYVAHTARYRAPGQAPERTQTHAELAEAA